MGSVEMLADTVAVTPLLLPLLPLLPLSGAVAGVVGIAEAAAAAADSARVAEGVAVTVAEVFQSTQLMFLGSGGNHTFTSTVLAPGGLAYTTGLNSTSSPSSY
jgi:hypothetical protein